MFPEDFLIENCHFKFLLVWMFECGSFIYFKIWLFFASCPRWFARAWVSMRNLLRSWEKSYPRRCAYRTRSFPKLAMSIKRKSVSWPPMTLMTLIFNDHYSLWIWKGKVELQGVSMVASPNFHPQIHQKKHRVRGLCRAGGTLCPFGLAVLGWYRQANWRMTIVFVATLWSCPPLTKCRN